MQSEECTSALVTLSKILVATSKCPEDHQEQHLLCMQSSLRKHMQRLVELVNHDVDAEADVDGMREHISHMDELMDQECRRVINKLASGNQVEPMEVNTDTMDYDAHVATLEKNRKALRANIRLGGTVILDILREKDALSSEGRKSIMNSETSGGRNIRFIKYCKGLTCEQFTKDVLEALEQSNDAMNARLANDLRHHLRWTSPPQPAECKYHAIQRMNPRKLADHMWENESISDDQYQDIRKLNNEEKWGKLFSIGKFTKLANAMQKKFPLLYEKFEISPELLKMMVCTCTNDTDSIATIDMLSETDSTCTLTIPKHSLPAPTGALTSSSYLTSAAPLKTPKSPHTTSTVSSTTLAGNENGVRSDARNYKDLKETIKLEGTTVVCKFHEIRTMNPRKLAMTMWERKTISEDQYQDVNNQTCYEDKWKMLHSLQKPHSLSRAMRVQYPKLYEKLKLTPFLVKTLVCTCPDATEETATMDMDSEYPSSIRSGQDASNVPMGTSLSSESSMEIQTPSSRSRQQATHLGPRKIYNEGTAEIPSMLISNNNRTMKPSNIMVPPAPRPPNKGIHSRKTNEGTAKIRSIPTPNEKNRIMKPSNTSSSVNAVRRTEESIRSRQDKTLMVQKKKKSIQNEIQTDRTTHIGPRN